MQIESDITVHGGVGKAQPLPSNLVLRSINSLTNLWPQD
jgi:hypothetical protein